MTEYNNKIFNGTLLTNNNYYPAMTLIIQFTIMKYSRLLQLNKIQMKR